MEENQDGKGKIVRIDRNSPSRWSGSVSRMLVGLLGVGVVGTLLVPKQGSAQFDRSDEWYTSRFITTRSSVRPRDMATGTRNERAGWTNGVYVPSQCVGTRRCPLIVRHSPNPEWVIPVADKYGFLIVSGYSGDATRSDEALKRTLQQFAVDPDKIAILGQCADFSTVIARAAKNLEVFSRVIVLSGVPAHAAPTVDPPNNRTEFYVEDAIVGNHNGVRTVRELRRAGHRVKHVYAVRDHGTTPDVLDDVGRWLAESWAIPDPAARPAPDTIAEVLLTTEAIAKMNAFWESLVKEPDWMLTIVRRQNQREVVMNLAKEHQPASMIMMNMPALAAKYEAIANDLRDAGLTAQQHDEYRMAIFSAERTRDHWRALDEAVLTTSVLGKNVVFLDQHPDLFEQGAISSASAGTNKAGMWSTP